MTQTTDQPTPDLEIRRGDERGTTVFDWLTSRHSFSFGHYHEPNRSGYHGLRVINEDIIVPSAGFGEHGHRNMEIITWVLAGSLAHRDSMGNQGVLQPGEAQVMSAGRGIRHSEMNGSTDREAWFLQVWIEPSETDIEPRYAHRAFDPAGRAGRWQTLASPAGRDGSLPIHRDAVVRVADLIPDHPLELRAAAHRFAYLHLATGQARAGQTDLAGGDAALFAGPGAVTLHPTTPGQVLWFDLR